MKYLSEINVNIKTDKDILNISIPLYFIDFITLNKKPSLLVEQVCKCYINRDFLSDELKDDIYRQIIEITSNGERDFDIISGVCKSLVYEMKYSFDNLNDDEKDLIKYASGLVVTYIPMVNDKGLVNINFSRLKYWDFLILTELQRNTINKYNENIKR